MVRVVALTRLVGWAVRIWHVFWADQQRVRRHVDARLSEDLTFERGDLALSVEDPTGVRIWIDAPAEFRSRLDSKHRSSPQVRSPHLSRVVGLHMKDRFDRNLRASRWKRLPVTPGDERADDSDVDADR